ncbi:hypothetical protein WISP_116047 [Willisornis vidua]|uniref:Uncharacterized protein n=1 Tax=Willisornis vidua TaxID=1566151 RepID=A0ABQ9CZJ9_9PASS|nr:hypothetical protein WISP_116047 [Willisornis vidua]
MPKEASEQLAQGSGVPDDGQFHLGVKVSGWPLAHSVYRRECLNGIGSELSDGVSVWDPASGFFAETRLRPKVEFCIAAEVIQMPGTTGQF